MINSKSPLPCLGWHRRIVAVSAESRRAVVISLLALGSWLAIHNSWHPVPSAEEIAMNVNEVLWLFVGLLIGWLAVSSFAPSLRPRENFRHLFTEEAKTSLWFMSLPAVFLMTVLIFWMNPFLGVWRFPFYGDRTAHAMSGETIILIRGIGLALMLLGAVPWLARRWLKGATLQPWMIVLGAWLVLLPFFWLDEFDSIPDFPLLGYYDATTTNLPQLALFFGSLGLFILSTCHPSDFQRLKGVWQPWEWALVGALVVLSVGLRLYKLDQLFPVMLSDEPPYLMRTREIMAGQAHYLAHERLYGEMNLGANINAVLLEILGISLFKGRLMAAVVSGLTILPLYLAGRRLLNMQVGVLVCLFFVVQPLHFFFSRTMMNIIFDPFLGLCAIILIWDGLERGGRWKFALAGVLVGLGQYFYVGSRMWLVLIPLWWGIMWLRYPRQWGVSLKMGLIWGMGLLFALAPLLAENYASDIDFMGRQVEMVTYEGNDSALRVFERSLERYFYEDLHTALRAYYDMGDATEHYEVNSRTAVNLEWAWVVVALGVAYALRFAPHPILLFFLLWLAITTFFGGSLPRDTPGFSRYVNATIPLAVLGGLGVYWMVQALAQVSKSSALPSFGMVALMSLVCVQNWNFIWNIHAPYFFEQVADNRIIGNALVKWMLQVRAEDPEAQVIFLIDEQYVFDRRYFEIYYFYRGQLDFTPIEEPLDDGWLVSLNTKTHNTYIFVAPRAREFENAPNGLVQADVIAQIQSIFPSAEVLSQTDYEFPYGRVVPLYRLLMIPQGAVARDADFLKSATLNTR